MKKKYKNTTQKLDVSHWRHEKSNSYKYQNLTPYLYLWSGLFQRVISQAGTHMFTKKFHNRDCGIYKCEGGCVIDGVGELVLGSDSCYFDYGRLEKKETKMAELITHVVLNWDPMNPIESMIHSAAEFIDVEDNVLKAGIAQNDRSGGPFGGNALSNFFNHNPFSSDNPMTNHRDYERFCYVEIMKEDEAEVEEMFRVRDLSRKLLDEMKSVVKEKSAGKYIHSPMCCSPRKMQDGKYSFWINTGRSTPIDGLKSQSEIEEFIKQTKENGLTEEYING